MFEWLDENIDYLIKTGIVLNDLKTDNILVNIYKNDRLVDLDEFIDLLVHNITKLSWFDFQIFLDNFKFDVIFNDFNLCYENQE